MAKQIKRTKEDASNFFDEMEEKMDAETNKKRKLNKKPGLSQPELLFLQFNPKPATDGENVCYFSSKGSSQPTGNKSTSNKKSWRPPMKVCMVSGDFEPKISNNEQLLHPYEDVNVDDPTRSIDTNFKGDSKTSEHVQSMCLEMDSTVLLSSLLRHPNTKPQTITINLSHSNPSLTESKESFTNQQSNSCPGITLGSQDYDMQTGISVQEEAANLKCKPCLNEDLSCSFVDNKSESSFLLKGESSISNLLTQPSTTNIYDSKIEKGNNNIKLEEMKNNPTFNESLTNYKKVSEEDDDKNPEKEIDSELKEIISFADMLTQENPRNNRKTNEIHNISEYNNNSDNRNYNGYKEIAENKIEVEVQSSVFNNIEHDRKLNNSVMILISGDETNHSSENINNTNKMDIGEDTKQTLVDSVFENSSSNDESECCESNNKNISDDKSVLEITKDVKQHMLKSGRCSKVVEEQSVEMREVNNKKAASIEEKEEEMDKKEQIYILSSPVKINHKEMEEKKETIITNNENFGSEILSVITNKENRSIDQNIAFGTENKFDVTDDENSCLMISNSQLLEIEKNFYETPLNNQTTTSLTNNMYSKACNDAVGNNRFVSVGTQTDVEEYINKPFKIPPVQWPNKMTETQKKLRESIKEIERLNSILLRIRQEIWPQRNLI